MNPYYIDYDEYLKRFYGRVKVQKISVNTGGTCPNRDGKIGFGGCIYCNNTSFTPHYCFETSSLEHQLEAGRSFFSGKYPAMKFLPYFQSFTSTYGISNEEMKQMFQTALNWPYGVGIIISTRPDCLEEEKICILEDLNQQKRVFVELGVESMDNTVLHMINRGHTSQQTEETIRRLKSHGLQVGAHVIAGLPGESQKTTLAGIDRLCNLGVDSIKLHHLQVLKDTPLATKVENHEIFITPWELEDYIQFCKAAIKVIDRRAAIERFVSSAPSEMVIKPKWGIKNYEFTNKLIKSIKG